MSSLETWRCAGETMSWRGHRIFLRRAESAGPPLLLIHGVPGGGWVWHRVWPALAQRFSPVAPDLIGFGFSDKPPGFRYDLTAYADQCEAVMAEAGAGGGKVLVLAHDHGDAVAAELLARGRVAGAVFLNGGVVPGADRPPPMLRLMTGRLGRPLTRFLLKRPFQARLAAMAGPAAPLSAEDLEALWTLTVRGGGRRVMPRLMAYRADRLARRARLTAALRDAAVPLHLVLGADDPLDAGAARAAWRETRPGAPVTDLSGVGHFPPLEAPDAVAAAVDALAEAARA
ncbi:alpha/beta fold hydrolase [Caenispirillum salinarum]|uniref:alpha/beta fold hydrolase n=1 Tax=Caenispirillum salinarum TaxID=859058 RepID=UPI00384AEC70